MDASPQECRRIQNEVVVDHLWLADLVARRFANRGQDHEDLLQVARGGLIEAVRRYDYRHGDFVPFAVPTMTGLIKRYFRDHAWAIRPPRETQELSTQIRRVWPEMLQRMGHEPSTAELADRLGTSVGAVGEAVRAGSSYRHCSLDGAADGGLHAIACGPDEYAAQEARIAVQQICASLTGEERRLLWMRFYEERSQADIAAELGTNQMRVSRLLSRTLAKLRREMAEDLASSA